jgi:hypothetical protein
MEYILKIAEYHLKPGSQNVLLYTDDKDELFIGPVKNVIVGQTYRVEVGHKLVGTCYRNIISWRDC